MVKSSVVLIPRYRVGMLPRYGEEGAGILAEEQHYLKPKQQIALVVPCMSQWNFSVPSPSRRDHWGEGMSQRALDIWQRS